MYWESGKCQHEIKHRNSCSSAKSASLSLFVSLCHSLSLCLLSPSLSLSGDVKDLSNRYTFFHLRSFNHLCSLRWERENLFSSFLLFSFSVFPLRDSCKFEHRICLYIYEEYDGSQEFSPHRPMIQTRRLKRGLCHPRPAIFLHAVCFRRLKPLERGYTIM